MELVGKSPMAGTDPGVSNVDTSATLGTVLQWSS